MQRKSCSTNLLDFIYHFKFDNFGNHQRVTLDFASFNKEFNEIRELLLQAEIHDFRPIFTSVHYFTISTTKTETPTESRLGVFLSTWAYHSTFLSHHADLHTQLPAARGFGGYRAVVHLLYQRFFCM